LYSNKSARHVPPAWGLSLFKKKKKRKKERQRPMTTMKIPADNKIMIISPIKITSFESSSLLLVVK